MGHLSVRNLTRRSVPATSLFERAHKMTLPTWEVSLAFVGPTRAKELNHALRNKTYTPNVLSYTVGTRSGEVLICPSVAHAQASLHGKTPHDFMLALFIHGLFHLKGMRHGTTMEESERATLARVLGTRLKKKRRR